jgi:hypothetical protein
MRLVGHSHSFIIWPLKRTMKYRLVVEKRSSESTREIYRSPIQLECPHGSSPADLIGRLARHDGVFGAGLSID